MPGQTDRVLARYEARIAELETQLREARSSALSEAATRIGELCVADAADRYIVQRMQTVIRALAKGE